MSVLLPLPLWEEHTPATLGGDQVGQLNVRSRNSRAQKRGAPLYMVEFFGKTTFSLITRDGVADSFEVDEGRNAAWVSHDLLRNGREHIVLSSAGGGAAVLELFEIAPPVLAAQVRDSRVAFT